MTLIDHTNYSSFLKQSTTSRASTPNGNVFFDVGNNEIQLIGVDELATINYGNTTVATQIDVVASAGTFTRLTGSYLTDGFKPGHVFTSSAFTNGGNNTTKTILTVTALVITVTSNSGLVDETGSGNEVIANASQTNELNNFDGITMRGLYNFENARRRVDETLRKYKRATDGDYRFAGAFNFVNGVKLDGTDRNKIRGSGFQEFADVGDGQTNVDRIYHGVVSLVSIQGTTTPYWALVTATDEATLQAATWTNFVRAGNINEVVQVFGSTANGDAGAGSFDYKTRILVARVRSWGYNPGETTSVASGITEFSGFSGGYGVGESINPSNSYALADVFGGAQIAPWTGMTLEKVNGFVSGAIQINVVAAAGTFTRLSGSFLTDGFKAGQHVTFAAFTNGGNNVTKILSSVTALVLTVTDITGLVNETGGGNETATSIPSVETGFNEADGNFSWILKNTGGGTVQQCAAYLDALTLQDVDVDAGTGSYNGRKGRAWYSRNAAGKVVTASVGGAGLFIENLTTAEQQNVVMTDDSGATKTYPFFPEWKLTPGAAAIADANAWYHVFYADGAAAADFDTTGAVTVNDSSGNPMKGNVAASQAGGFITKAYAYDTNTQAGLAPGVDKSMVVIVEGDGGASQAITYFTMTRTTTVSVTCAPPVDTNA